MATNRVMAWLRVNLAVLTAASAVLTGAVVGLVNATTQIVQLRATTDEHTRMLAGLHFDMVSVDGRLNTQRQTEADALAAADKRMTLLEERLKWALDRVPASPRR